MSYPADINHCVFTGRVLTPPESRLAKNGTTIYTSWRLNTNSRVRSQGNKFKNDALFLNCVGTGAVGNYVLKYCFIGSTIMVEGRLTMYPPLAEYPAVELRVAQIHFVHAPMKTTEGENIYDADLDAQGGILDLAQRSLGAWDTEIPLAYTPQEINEMLDRNAERFDRNRAAKREKLK